MSILKFSFVFCLSFLLVACASSKHNLTTDTGTMAEADRLAKNEFFDEARRQYYRVKTEFSDSALHVEADYKIAKSYFSEESYTAAASSFEEFVRTYPGRPEVEDALFYQGLSYARQMPSTAQRDTRASAKTVDTFTRLLIEYPESKHLNEARNYIETARNQIIEKILNVARFYERKGEYKACANRYAEVAVNYADSSQAEEARARWVRCLRRSNQSEKAESEANTFVMRYPNSKFLSLIEK